MVYAIFKYYHISNYKNLDGRVAQLVEHYLDMVVVVGSSPIVATIKSFSRSLRVQKDKNAK